MWPYYHNRFFFVNSPNRVAGGGFPPPALTPPGRTGPYHGGSQVNMLHVMQSPLLVQAVPPIVGRNSLSYMDTPQRSSYAQPDTVRPPPHELPVHGIICCPVCSHYDRFLPQLEFGTSAASLRLRLSVCPGFHLWGASLASPDLLPAVPSADFPSRLGISPGKTHDFHAYTRRIYSECSPFRVRTLT